MESCPDCGIEYSTKRGLVRYHFYDNPSHAPNSWEQCPSCKKVFENLSNLHIHHKREHDVSISHTETCNVCGEEFVCRPSHNRKYCSTECSSIGREKWKSTVCPICEKEFEQKPSEGKTYCSRKCAAKNKQDRLTVNCSECGEPVTKKRQRIKRVDNVYCNEDCWKSNIETEEFRNSNNEKKFREKVFERDNYSCQDCGKVGGTLNAHHIERVSEKPELANNTSNGITLCVDCHAKRHEKSGEDRAARLIRSKYEL